MASNQDLDQKIQEVYKRIQTERKVLEASQLLRQATTNQEVLRRNEAQIREAEKSLSYFEDALKELQSRKLQAHRQSSVDSPRTLVNPSGLPPGPRGWTDRDRALPSPPAGGAMDLGPRSPQDEPLQKPKHYTNLDLIRADTPYTPAKISKMLHQLEFKLQVEKQYKKGIDQMAKAYQADGDKKSRMDAQNQRVESDKTIHLLQTALKRYKNLKVLDDVIDDEEELPVDGERKGNLRKPLSGKLEITIKAAKELEHAPVIKKSKAATDTTVVLKIEGNARARSHPSRTDRWNEFFEISVEKANEIEITVYDKQGSEQAPIGLMWIRISDLVEALRRQKVGMETGGGKWVTAAGAMNGEPGGYPGAGPPYSDGPIDPSMGGMGMPAMRGDLQPEGIEGWFSLEPVGALLLHLNFVKENVRKRPIDAGLGRQGAVRKRKDEVHEMNGHKFVQRQFYQLILCAFCSEFLLNAVGYQCEDCRYTCHKKCYEKVVTKCISKSNADTEGDEEKINHRIPHRFETITNIGTNWCCHCGYMLPLGRKNAKKCSECDIACHASCAHLVPDFCGMSMERANTILASLRDIKSQKQRLGQAPRPQPAYTAPPALESGQDQAAEQMGRLALTGSESAPSPPQYGRMQSAPPMGYDARYGGMPPSGTPPVMNQQQQQLPYTQSPIQPSSRPTLPYITQEQQYPNIPPSGYDPSMQMPQPHRQQPPPLGVDYQRPYQPRPLPPTGVPTPERAPSIPQPVQGQPPPIQPQRTVRKRKVGLDDFNFLAVLGKGNFGKVMLAEEKKTSNLYAIKVLKKEFIIDNDEVESTRSEKRVFLAAARERHPFLLGLHSCFQTETRVYFVMEYVSGGDLMLHIQRKQFSLRQAKFYAAEVLLALEYFHSQGIIYRDLKLDNILLTTEGHIKVADYGLCKEEMWYGQTTSTFCGTPEFMAPEILLEQRYGRAVDWWAFGVLMYEMLLGQSPFRGDDEDEIFDAILEDEPLYPITMPKDAVSILQKLLTRDPARRLGSGKLDADEIKRHPFFKDVNFDDVFNKRIPPPYFPTISNASDTGNFDPEFTREQPTLTPVHGQLTSRDQQEFLGFSWVAQWADM